MLKACMPLAKYCEEVSAESDAGEEPSTMKQRSMFDEIMEVEVTPRVSIRSQVEEEIASYLKAQQRPQDDCPLDYWRNETRFPTVKSLQRYTFLSLPLQHQFNHWSAKLAVSSGLIGANCQKTIFRDLGI